MMIFNVSPVIEDIALFCPPPAILPITPEAAVSPSFPYRIYKELPKERESPDNLEISSPNSPTSGDFIE